jgi:hypothetical protein
MHRGKLYRRSTAETSKLKQPQSTRICLASPNIRHELESEPHTFDELRRPNSLSVVRELASQGRRFGYRRLGLPLAVSELRDNISRVWLFPLLRVIKCKCS